MDEDLGDATIVYEHPDEGTVEETLDNEHVVLAQDHWTIKRDDEGSAGRDVVRRIPKERVHYVERSVEEFEREVATLAQQVESVADDIRSKLLGGRGRGDDESDRQRENVRRIDVESGEATSTGASTGTTDDHGTLPDDDETGDATDDGTLSSGDDDVQSDDGETDYDAMQTDDDETDDDRLMTGDEDTTPTTTDDDENRDY